jgi:hypothetical protein
MHVAYHMIGGRTAESAKELWSEHKTVLAHDGLDVIGSYLQIVRAVDDD